MKERSPSESIAEMRQEAREKIMGVIKKYSNDPNIKIMVEKDRETPEIIFLELMITNPENNETKTYHKGFMKVPKLPNDSFIEDVVENEIMFPEKSIEGD